MRVKKMWKEEERGKEKGKESRRNRGRRLIAAALVLAMALGATAAFAQEEEAAAEEKGAWTVTGWARANTGWDLEGETNLPKPDGDWDATGAAATLTWTKGAWKLAGTAEVTSEKFGFIDASGTSLAGADTGYGASGNIQATYAKDGWEAYLKTAQNFATGALTAQFSVSKWDQAADLWGFKGVANFNNYAWFPMVDLDFVPESGDNKLGLFINFWDKKILLEAGYGDYTENTVWQSPGPLETQYEHADDKDSLLRLQVKPVEGLNLGFAYLPGYYRKTLGPGYNNQAAVAGSDPAVLDPNTATFKPVDTIRATTLGVKYASGPLTIAAGLNPKEDAEQFYLGGAYKLLDNKLTLSLDGNATKLGIFGDEGAFNLGEKVAFVDDPDATRFTLGLTLKQENLVHNSGGSAADDLKFTVSPSVSYVFIEKVAKAALNLDFVKDGRYDDLEWKITPVLGWSVKESPATDPDDIGTGFVVKYIFGQDVNDDTGVVSDLNKFYFGFRIGF